MSKTTITRRNFLQGMGAGAGSMAIASPLALLSGCATAPDQSGSYLKPLVLKENVSAVYCCTDVMLQAIRNQTFTPPIATRALAMGHVAGFLAVNGVEKKYNTPYDVQDAPSNVVPEIAYTVAVLTAAQDAFDAVFYFDKKIILDKYPNDDAKAASIKYGEYVASVVVKDRTNDGAEPNKANFYLGRYPRRQDILKWSPTGPFYGAEEGPFLGTFHRGLLPGWGAVKPWAMKSKSKYLAVEFPDARSPEFGEQFKKLKALGAHDSKVRTEEETEIAFFWEDGPRGVTPPGHWQLIAMLLSQHRNYSLLKQAKLFALLSMSQADAAITAWDSKYTHDIIRPETTIRQRAHKFDNPMIKDGLQRNWRSLIFTPDFPAYTSGHSTFSGVSARMIANFLGTDKVSFSLTPPDLVNWPKQLSGVKRSWTSLWQAAEENGASRIYGGVHWDYDNTEGLRVGKELADEVYKTAFEVRV
ncbi:MAG: phosphatase PAP2 family protein [Alcanivorax sp.]